MALGRTGLLLAAILCAAPAWAEDRSDKVVSAFKAWLVDQEITAGQIAVAYRGDILATEAIASAGPVDLASLSKAITAACVQS